MNFIRNEFQKTKKKSVYKLREEEDCGIKSRNSLHFSSVFHNL
jgi:hypothetical protein